MKKQQLYKYQYTIFIEYRKQNQPIPEESRNVNNISICEITTFKTIQLFIDGAFATIARPDEKCFPVAADNVHCLDIGMSEHVIYLG